jgi:excisionase family DNA binding protein
MAQRSRLLTSTEAADFLGASPTSVKRWADEGMLPCVRTAGRHRRFTQEDLERFARDRMGVPGRGGPDGASGDVEGWIQDLTEARPYRIQARLYEARSDLGSWRAVCDALGPVIDELGSSWAAGRITVVQEHLASEQLTRALARVSDTVPLPEAAPRAMLATLEDEEHTLGLSLVELALRELGWRSVWIGRKTPLAGLAKALDDQGVSVLAISASIHASDKMKLRQYVRDLRAMCEPRQIQLLLGGRGAWPRPPAYGVVVDDFQHLGRVVPRPDAIDR